MPCIDRLVERNHGRLDNYLMQVLIGHGSYSKYLHRFGQNKYPDCFVCAATPEEPEHVTFQRSELVDIRRTSSDALNPVIGPHNLVKEMLRSDANWSAGKPTYDLL